ncbi:aminopeptidase [Candidatus Dojkabacteria bacterium]|jgi:aminopeptidase|nr:aminopeptidase [Candidatus Dojkabacteria bacterium]
MFNDPRNTALAKVFVEHSLKVKKGDKVVISTSDLDCEDIVRECMKLILKKGAYLYLDIMGWNWLIDRSSKGDFVKLFYDYANEDQLKNIPTIYKNIVDWGDKFVRITTFDNYSNMNGVDAKKKAIRASARETWFHEIIKKGWVLTYYPTPALAMQCGMSFSQFTDFYFNATLVDYKKMEKSGEKILKLLDKGKAVRVVGEGTDIKMSIDGRLADNAAGDKNIPDGEVFIAPVRKTVQGEILFDLPNFKDGVDVVNAKLIIKDGKVVKASATAGEDVLLSNLDTDAGARYFGELGIGLNYGITRPMRTTLFDEKIGGTIHMALGNSYEDERGGALTGGNKSAIHWDMVKDMRKKGSKIYIDDKLVFEEGKWL